MPPLLARGAGEGVKLPMKHFPLPETGISCKTEMRIQERMSNLVFSHSLFISALSLILIFHGYLLGLKNSSFVYCGAKREEGGQLEL